MVRKIKVVNICATEETARADEDEQEEQAIEPTETKEPEAAIDETSADTEEGAAVAESAAAAPATAVEEPSPKPIDMHTNSKILEQVSCSACGKFMSAKNLRYAHKKYCTERAPDEPPPEITTPDVELEEPPPETNIKKVPVKRAKAKAKPQPNEEEQPNKPTLENGGVLPSGIEAPYKGQMDIEESPEQFWRRTMKEMKEKKKSQYKKLCSNAF